MAVGSWKSNWELGIDAVQSWEEMAISESTVLDALRSVRDPDLHRDIVALKFVKDLPKTRNAKVMRRIIRAAYLGQDPGDTSSLENPQAVEEIRHAT